MFQPSLNLLHHISYQHEDFLVSDSNYAAYEYIEQWPEAWRGLHTIIWGEEGCGKTHLAHIWAKKNAGIFLPLRQLNQCLEHIIQSTPQKNNAIIIEDADVYLSQDPALEEDLFHLINAGQQQNIFLLITAKTPPSRWNIKLKDLSSRLNVMTAMHILPPDDMLLRAVLIKLFSDRQLTISHDIIEYIIPRIERNFKAMQTICQLIDAISLEQKRNITLALVKKILSSTTFTTF